MKHFAILVSLAMLSIGSVSSAQERGEKQSVTKVAIIEGQWRINGEVTYAGAKAEGLLMNVRMVNSTFEDANDKTRPKGFDSDANTEAFLKRIPDYKEHGVRA